MHMTSLLLSIAFLTLSHAVELPHLLSNVPASKPEQQLPEHIQTLINNHINHVLQHVKNNRPSSGQVPLTQTTTLVGQVPPAVGTATPLEPLPSVLPSVPHSGSDPATAVHKQKVPAEVQLVVQQVQAHLPQVINHQAAGVLLPGSASMSTSTSTSTPLVQNKVLPQVVVSLPGQAPLDIGDKVNKLQERVNFVMQQAQKHIPQAINQAIRERQRKATSTTTTTTTAATTTTSTTEMPVQSNPHVVPLKSSRALALPPYVSNVVQQVHQHVPHLLNKHIEQQKLGKCNFECPQKALPVCASNGKCVVEFPGQCELSKWNCFNTKNIFRQVHDAECQSIIKCYDRDMM